MMSASWPRSRKYSPIVQPEYGEMYCIAAESVADDQLALAAADRHHCVDGLEPCLHGLRHALSPDDAGRYFLDDIGRFRWYGSLAVDRLTERVDHAPDQLGTNGHFENTPRTL